MQFSNFGNKFSRTSTIKQLMKDLGDANAKNDPNICMLGGGNPAPIEDVQQIFNKEMQALMRGNEFRNMLGLYDAPQGEARFIEVLTDYLNQHYQWGIRPTNIALTNGSQNSFFYLFNLLSGDMPDKQFKKILLPLAPEYVGYADLGLSEQQFTSNKPKIEQLENRQFKYHIDFSAMDLDNDIAALCLSRPTNPTGNVISDQELAKLDQLAQEKCVPLIVDNAYGLPFPGVIHCDATTQWNNNTVLCMSLSKLGMPGARTGIIIANEDIIEAVSSLSAIVTLAPNSIGAALMTRVIQDNELLHITNDIIKPFYKNKVDVALKLVETIFADLPVRIHKPEGAFFLWMWIEGLPISSTQLYQRLKAKNVFVIPGESFFIDIDPNWQHTKECLRINYAVDQDTLERGLTLIAEELRGLF